MEEKSHSGMDRQIETQRWTTGRKILLAAVVLVPLILWAVYAKMMVRSTDVGIDQLKFAKVERGLFKDVIPLRATVEPIKTVFIDAVQGGSVAEVLVEEGSRVNVGDVLLKLNNVNFQLQVSSQEALISEQLNTNSSVRLQLDQNLLTLEQRLNDINYAITKLERQLERNKVLYTNKMVSPSAMDVLQDELDYQVRQKKLIETTIEREKQVRTPKIAQLAESDARLKADAKIIHQTLDSLLVRSPIKGLLTSLKAEIGQIIPVGHRVGQVDNVDSFKLKAEIDEFYISRIAVGQKAQFNLDGADYSIVIDRVYPQVTGGKFNVSLAFVGKAPASARPGLRISTQLELGASVNSLLLQKGSFFQDTGGRWVFVVDGQSKKAERREIQVGRSNADYIEIKSGLKEGDNVITSSYANFLTANEVTINTNK